MEDPSPERRLSNPVEILHRLQKMNEASRVGTISQNGRLADPFEYLNVEEIPEDSDLLSALFTDSLPWYRDAILFGTLLISGHRGCGKSMVLKNMRLKTKLTSEKGRKEVLADNYVG